VQNLVFSIGAKCVEGGCESLRPLPVMHTPELRYNASVIHPECLMI